MAVPFIVILPGLLGLVVLQNADGSLMHLVGENLVALTPGAGLHSYNEVLPLMMVRYMGPGLLGLGITALDRRIHERHGRQCQRVHRHLHLRHLSAADRQEGTRRALCARRPHGDHCRRHCLHRRGLPRHECPGIMDYVQALFSFFISPLLGAVLVGMFWKRATKAGGFWGLLIGTLTSIGLVGLGLF